MKLLINKHFYSFLLLLVLLASVILPLSIQAQTSSDAVISGFCNLSTPVTVSVQNRELQAVDDIFSNKIIIENVSNAHIGDLKVLLGIFSDDELVFTSVLDAQKSLHPLEKTTVLADVDVAGLQSGEYSYKVVAAQGLTNALSELLLQSSGEQVSTFLKGTPASVKFRTELTMNGIDLVQSGQEVDPGPLEFSVTTSNETDSLLTNLKVHQLLMNGAIPFGNAVEMNKVDVAKLLPGSERTSVFSTKSVRSGAYTAITMYDLHNVATPVIATLIQIGKYSENLYHTRIRSVGVGAQEALLTGAVCFDELVGTELRSGIIANVPFSFTQEKPDVEPIITYTNTNPSAFINLSLLSSSSLTRVELLESRNTPSSGVRDASLDDFDVTQEISLSFDCMQHDICLEEVEEVSEDGGANQSLDNQDDNMMFYIIAIIGVLLIILLYIRFGWVKPKEEPMHYPEK